jgi:diguanylate cyclase (GGDEF)-like protein
VVLPSLLWVLCLLHACWAVRAQPAEPLPLRADAGVVDAWPAVTVLSDPTGIWQLEDVQRKTADLRAPGGAKANLGLNGFKAVNDRLGHDAGDELLKAVAERLRSPVRRREVVARLGGDEFVVMATGLMGDDEARRLDDKLLDTFATPLTLRWQPCKVGLTIGYALAPLDGSDSASLLAGADAAMYAGKQAGKHTLRRGQASVGLATA